MPFKRRLYSSEKKNNFDLYKQISYTNTLIYTNMQIHTLTSSVSPLFPVFLVYGGKYNENTDVYFCAFILYYLGGGLNSLVFEAEYSLVEAC